MCKTQFKKYFYFFFKYKYVFWKKYCFHPTKKLFYFLLDFIFPTIKMNKKFELVPSWFSTLQLGDVVLCEIVKVKPNPAENSFVRDLDPSTYLPDHDYYKYYTKVIKFDQMFLISSGQEIRNWCTPHLRTDIKEELIAVKIFEEDPKTVDQWHFSCTSMSKLLSIIIELFPLRDIIVNYLYTNSIKLTRKNLFADSKKQFWLRANTKLRYDLNKNLTRNNQVIYLFWNHKKPYIKTKNLTNVSWQISWLKYLNIKPRQRKDLCQIYIY